MLLITLGRDPKNLRPSLVTQTLKGLRHLEEEQGKRAVRQVVTIQVLQLLHMLLMKKNRLGWSRRKRATIWAGCMVNSYSPDYLLHPRSASPGSKDIELHRKHTL